MDIISDTKNNRHPSQHGQEGQEEKIIFWISRFKGGNVADKAYQRSIIDVFVNKIFVFDDRIVITYNYKDGENLKWLHPD